VSGPPLSNPQGVSRGTTGPPAGQILIPDACVGVQWFVPEPDSVWAARLLDPRFELHVPAYFFIEAASALQRKVAVERTLSEAEGLDTIQFLQKIPLTVHTTEGLLEYAFRHGVRYRRPVYDSLYLVLAEALGGRVVTGDRRLYNGVHGGPLDHLILWITDPL
jgi:predicted nucleic acid-binding protein